MSDIGHILPDAVFDKHAELLQLLEDNFITTSDLISTNAVDIARRVNCPVNNVRELAAEVTTKLHSSVTVSTSKFSDRLENARPSVVTLLDEDLDQAIGGGIRTGCITEIVGPSGVGKTQFLLLALLSAQLRSPKGIGRPSLYISTEHALPTQRLTEMLQQHTALANARPRPTLARILTLHAPDLETQDHVVQFQLPVVLARHNVGLVVIDSIAANYRAEDVRNHGAGLSSSKNQGRLMSNRSAELIRLGGGLRELARKYDCAVLVANQVADRMEEPSLALGPSTPGSSPAGPPSSSLGSSQGVGTAGATNLTQGPSSLLHGGPLHLPANVLNLDYQQRWFSGWGDQRPSYMGSLIPDFAGGGGGAHTSGAGGPGFRDLKTPALGLVWTNQITCRISLHKHADWQRRAIAAVETIPAHGTGRGSGTHPNTRAVVGTEVGKGTSMSLNAEGGTGGADWSPMRWRRRIRLAFAPWAPACKEDDMGTEYEIWAGGLKSVGRSV